MTDKEKFIALLKSWGFEEIPKPESHWYALEDKQFYLSETPNGVGNPIHMVCFNQGHGYSGFGHDFGFDSEGKYLTHGAYE